MAENINWKNAKRANDALQAALERARSIEHALPVETIIQHSPDPEPGGIIEENRAIPLTEATETDVDAFVSDIMEESDGATVTKNEAYNAYTRWAHSSNKQVLSVSDFSKKFNERAYPQIKINGRTRYVGIRIKDSPIDDRPGNDQNAASKPRSLLGSLQGALDKVRAATTAEPAKTGTVDTSTVAVDTTVTPEAAIENVQKFIEQSVENKPGADILDGKLYSAYIAWCQMHGKESVMWAEFEAELEKRGFKTEVRANHVRYIDIAFKESGPVIDSSADSARTGSLILQVKSAAKSEQPTGKKTLVKPQNRSSEVIPVDQSIYSSANEVVSYPIFNDKTIADIDVRQALDQLQVFHSNIQSVIDSSKKTDEVERLEQLQRTVRALTNDALTMESDAAKKYLSRLVRAEDVKAYL